MALEQLAGNALSVTVIIVFAVVVLALIGGAYWMMMQKKKWSQFDCIVWEYDAFGQLHEKHDVAGIFVDKKTNNKRFFMKAANVGLEPDNIPYIKAPSGKSRVYLLRTGLKNFRFIKPIVGKDGSISFSVGEEDVNWGINAYERQKKMFAGNTLLQYMPFILLAFVSLIILIIFIYFFRHFGDLRDAADAFREGAKFLAMVKTNTTILPA